MKEKSLTALIKDLLERLVILSHCERSQCEICLQQHRKHLKPNLKLNYQCLNCYLPLWQAHPEVQICFLLALPGTVIKAIPSCQSRDADCEICKGQFLIREPLCFHLMRSSFQSFYGLVIIPLTKGSPSPCWLRFVPSKIIAVTR